MKIVSKIIALMLISIFSSAIYAQDYVLTETNENIVMKIVSYNKQQIVFTIFDDSKDTTLYSISYSNIKAIGFAGDMLKRMKSVSFKPEKTYKKIDTSQMVISYIYPTNSSEVVKAFIDTLTADQVRFKLANSTDTSIYFISKTDIAQITFREILKGQASEDNLSDVELTSKARADAFQNYDGYHAAAVGSFLSGMMVWFYFVPILVPISISSTPPSDFNLGNTNPKLMQHPAYAKSYTKTAQSIKSNKAWSNFGYGVATSLGLTVVLIFAAITSYR